MRSPAYASASAYLASRVRLGMKFGLETMRALVEELGHPETAYPTLLVAGTNGKGSVAAYVDAALRASGLRVGRYTSPHLVSVHERIAVGGRPVSDAELARAVLRVRAAARRLLAHGAIPAHPTYFEAMTAAAFDHFRRRRVDVAVIEVGLGGRLDATNVCEPLVSAIVSIDFDHERFLGHTLAAIAREKAGVMRPGRAVVVGPLRADARRAIAACAKAVGARLVAATEGACVEAGTTLSPPPGGEGWAEGETAAVTICTPRRRYGPLSLLPGAHQVTNALVAIRLLEEARAAGTRVDSGAVARALSGTRWPGRLQWLSGDPPLLLDGAHNPAGARALAGYLEALGPFVLVFGAMADKSIAAMAGTLFPLAREVVLTRLPMKRAAAPAAIARLAPKASPRIHRAATPAAALRLAHRLSAGAPVVVAGSLYLVGAMLRLASVAPSRPRGGSARAPRANAT